MVVACCACVSRRDGSGDSLSVERRGGDVEGRERRTRGLEGPGGRRQLRVPAHGDRDPGPRTARPAADRQSHGHVHGRGRQQEQGAMYLHHHRPRSHSLDSKPNSITLAGSELFRSWFEAG